MEKDSRVDEERGKSGREEELQQRDSGKRLPRANTNGEGGGRITGKVNEKRKGQRRKRRMETQPPPHSSAVSLRQNILLVFSILSSGLNHRQAAVYSVLLETRPRSTSNFPKESPCEKSKTIGDYRGVFMMEHFSQKNNFDSLKQLILNFSSLSLLLLFLSSVCFCLFSKYLPLN